MATEPFDLDDKDALRLVDRAGKFAESQQSVRDEMADRFYKMFHSFIDMTLRDPDRANVALPKIWNVIMTKFPRDVKAILGKRPFIPFEAKRDDLKPISKSQCEFLDYTLEKSNYFFQACLTLLIKIVQGTCFLESIPYFKYVDQPLIKPRIIAGIPAGYDVQYRSVPRMRFKIRSLAPWEIKFCPYTIGLEEADQCRFAIKLQLGSKRMIRKLHAQKAYRDLDLDKLNDPKASASTELSKHWGYSILSSMGIPQPEHDDDMGLIMRFESPGRYIDVWNGQVVLRDGDNPYKHKLINLSRFVHNPDAHPQNQFYGIGEVKPAEILATLLNDMTNMTIDNHNFMNQGMTYYDINSGVDSDDLKKVIGGKVPVELKDNQRIEDVIKETFGHSLPADHYIMSDRIERMIDLTTRVYDVTRGESSGNDQTATEVAFLQGAGDTSQELNVKMVEMFMADFGGKCLSHADQYATWDDKVEVLGQAEAMKMFLVNPNDLPGGFNYSFTGSEKVTNQLIKQRNLKELSALIMSSPNLRQDEWLKTLLAAFDEGDNVDNLVIPDEVIAMQNAQVAMLHNEVGAFTNKEKGQGRFKDNNPAQFNREQSREATAI